MKISIGADHKGYLLKQALLANLKQYEWLDQGTNSEERTDYPLYAQQVCKDVVEGRADYGMLICWTGIGMAIAANRFKGIYAALCWSEEVTKLARSHDNANILVLPAGFIVADAGVNMVEIFIKTNFLGDRYQQRLCMIDTK